MKTFLKFPSIIQFANVVKHVRDTSKWNVVPLPTLKFSGSVKLHGTNAGIGFSPDGDVWFQSRENLITYEKDNAGFATWGEQNLDFMREIYKIVLSENNIEHDAFYIFGEWFGASIQKGVAVSQLTEKKFGIFEMSFVKFQTKIAKRFLDGVEIEEEVNDDAITKIDPVQFHNRINTLLSNVIVVDYIVPPIELEIDFAAPHLVQNKLLELTLAVENECPVGKHFGISGVGEGLVWSAVGVKNIAKFKTKGEKHSASKVKVVHELTDAEIQSKESVGEFVEYACTQNRLEQGISKLGEMGLEVDIKSMGAYLKWVGSDILTECHDVLVQSGIEKKHVMPAISNKARTWFINYINETLEIV